MKKVAIRAVYQLKISIANENSIKTFQIKKILSVYYHRPFLRQILRNLLKAEIKGILYERSEKKKLEWQANKVARVLINLNG